MSNITHELLQPQDPLKRKIYSSGKPSLLVELMQTLSPEELNHYLLDIQKSAVQYFKYILVEIRRMGNINDILELRKDKELFNKMIGVFPVGLQWLSFEQEAKIARNSLYRIAGYIQQLVESETGLVSVYQLPGFIEIFLKECDLYCQLFEVSIEEKNRLLAMLPQDQIVAQKIEDTRIHLEQLAAAYSENQNEKKRVSEWVHEKFAKLSPVDTSKLYEILWNENLTILPSIIKKWRLEAKGDFKELIEVVYSQGDIPNWVIGELRQLLPDQSKR